MRIWTTQVYTPQSKCRADNILCLHVGSLVNEQQLQCDYGQLIDALAQSEKYLEDSLHQNSQV